MTIRIIEHLAKNIGLIPVQISSTSKISYHASSVMSCNYIVDLIYSAINIEEKDWVDKKNALLSLNPIVAATLDNISKMGTADSLTGPIARGDTKTISHHLHELALKNEGLTTIYRTMGLYTAELAVKKGTITAEKAKKIKTF